MNKLLIMTTLAMSSFLYCGGVSAEALEVEVVYPQKSQQTQTLSLIGTVESPNDAALAPLQSGVIATFNVEKGQMVKKGEPLLVLDSELTRLDLEQAQAELAASKVAANEALRLYEEVLDLAQQQLAAQTLIASRKSDLAVAKAQVQSATSKLKFQQTLLKRHTLVAPFSGLIVDRLADVGEWVTQQTPVLQLTSQTDLRLAVAIPQEYFHRLHQAQKVRVKVTPDFAEATSVEAELSVLVNSASNRSRTLTGLITLPQNPDWLIGMSASAEIQLPESEQAIVWLPQSAIKQHPDGGRSVFAVENNTAKQILVEIKQTNQDKVAVAGLRSGLPVVVTGVAVIRDGAELNVKSTVQVNP